jgi:polygalacturonase
MKMIYNILILIIFLINIIKSNCYCNIKDDFNASGNGIDLDDEALINALQQCSGERITFPSGIYLLSPFNLTSNTELYLSNHDSIIIASSDYQNWPLVEPLPSYPETSLRVSPFIGGNNIHNISITGLGTIDGNGKIWWDASDNHLLSYGRPRLIEPMYCTKFTMSDVTIVNPGFWAIHPYACDVVLLENIIYSAPYNSPNTDGIDPDSCSNVVISNFTSSCGDDSISVKRYQSSYLSICNSFYLSIYLIINLIIKLTN